MKTLITFATLVFSAGPLSANSYYTDRLDDRQAIYLTGDKFSIHGDGIADDSDVLQQAINRVQQTTNQGILFLPYGRYRVTRTIYIWPGIRIIGYGETRPVLVLGRSLSTLSRSPSGLRRFCSADQTAKLRSSPHAAHFTPQNCATAAARCAIGILTRHMRLIRGYSNALALDHLQRPRPKGIRLPKRSQVMGGSGSLLDKRTAETSRSVCDSAHWAPE
jgi:Pectate lyase superfamily protein